MELQEIEIVIDKEAHVHLKVRGVKGQKCLELTEDMEAALGAQVVSRELTPEALAVSQEQTAAREWLWTR